MDNIYRVYINDEWEFFENQCENGKKVRIPHTVKELPFNYFDEAEYQMISNYKRVINAPKEWEGKRIFITFEGIAHVAKVYINGKKLAEHKCGYTAFSVELTDNLIYGKSNELLVEVDSRESNNVPPFGFVVDYMTYGGIYRDVYIEIKEKEYIKDVFVIPGIVNRTTGEVNSTVTIDGAGEFDVKQYLVDSEGNQRELACHKAVFSDSIEKRKVFKADYVVEQIKLWDIDNPNLYYLKTELYKNDNLLDFDVTRFGFRTVSIKDTGFYLNGNKVKIRGLNRHQSYPYVGYAMPESMQKYDAEILKNELGCNAVRTSHYPQSQYFIDRCDEIGLLVFMEIPGWQHIGDEQWKEQVLKNEEEMIVQFRNHPSIFLWGVRINESKDDDKLYKRTNKLAHKLDSSRPTGGVRCIKKSNLFEDVYTYNDFVHSGKNEGCEDRSKVTSDMSKGYLISEYGGHMYPTKAYDDEEHRVEHALRHARVLNDVNKYSDISGSFGWCMFDYNTHKDFGSGDRICYHGVMDMFRNPKLAALVYSCQQDETPVLELGSSMDIGEHPACNRGMTHIFTNADSVKMYKNNIFIKEYTKADSPFKNLRHGPIIIDDFIGDQLETKEGFTKEQAEIVKEGLNYAALNGFGQYPPKIMIGMAKCMAKYKMKPSDSVELFNKYIGDWGGSSTVYKFDAIKNGEIVKTIVKEPAKKLHFEHRISSEILEEKSTYDVAEVRIYACDDNNNQAYYFNDPIVIELEGPAEIIGPKVISFRGGMTGIYVKTIGKKGDIKIRLKNTQLGEDEIKIRVI